MEEKIITFVAAAYNETVDAYQFISCLLLQADPKQVYQGNETFLNHHSCTVSTRGFCWGRYPEFRQKLEQKWPGIKTT